MIDEMKVIFLDIDGVMITTNSPIGRFDPVCVKNLKQIMDRTGAYIVVSSTYRSLGFVRLKELFAANGITKGLIGVTPVIQYGIRGEEIKQYIEEASLDPSSTIDRFVIIDDNDNMGELRPYLIQTNGKIGLDERIRDKVIEFLMNMN